MDNTDHTQEGADEATIREKIDGLIEQIQADVELGSVVDPAAELQERIAEADLPVSAVEFERALARVRQPN